MQFISSKVAQHNYKCVPTAATCQMYKQLNMQEYSSTKQAGNIKQIISFANMHLVTYHQLFILKSRANSANTFR